MFSARGEASANVELFARSFLIIKPFKSCMIAWFKKLYYSSTPEPSPRSIILYFFEFPSSHNNGELHVKHFYLLFNMKSVLGNGMQRAVCMQFEKRSRVEEFLPLASRAFRAEPIYQTKQICHASVASCHVESRTGEDARKEKSRTCTRSNAMPFHRSLAVHNYIIAQHPVN